MTDLAYVIQ